MEERRMESSQVSKSEELKVLPYRGIYPRIADDVFLASGVKIIGDVEIGKGASIWYNSVVRGDVHYIRIGEMTNVQDLSMLHVTNGRFPLNIGSRVTIGHSTTLHGCTLHDLCFIGMGAVVLDGAVIEERAMVGAGAVIRQGFVVPSGMLAAGIPAKIIRPLTQEEMDDFDKSAERYRKYSEITIQSLAEDTR